MWPRNSRLGCRSRSASSHSEREQSAPCIPRTYRSRATGATQLGQLVRDFCSSASRRAQWLMQAFRCTTQTRNRSMCKTHAMGTRTTPNGVLSRQQPHEQNKIPQTSFYTDGAYFLGPEQALMAWTSMKRRFHTSCVISAEGFEKHYPSLPLTRKKSDLGWGSLPIDSLRYTKKTKAVCSVHVF